MIKKFSLILLKILTPLRNLNYRPLDEIYLIILKPSILKDLSFKIIEKFNKMDILEKCGGEKGGIFQY